MAHPRQAPGAHTKPARKAVGNGTATAATAKSVKPLARSELPRIGERARPRPSALARMVEDAAGRVVASWQTLLESDSDDGAHKFRVATRQLRVVLHILRRADDTGHLKRLRQSLAAVAREAGRLRDLDVLVQDLVAPLIDPHSPPGLTALREHLAHERERARVSMCAALKAPEFVAARRDVARLPAWFDHDMEIASGRRKIRKLARRDLQKRWQKFCRRAKHLEHLSPEALHEARKSLKSLRYALVEFTPFLDRAATKELQKRILKLQDLFGYLNDVENAKTLTERLGPAPADADLNCAIGFVLGVHTARAARARRKLADQHRRLAACQMARELEQ